VYWRKGAVWTILLVTLLSGEVQSQQPESAQDPFQQGLIALQKNDLDAALVAFTAAEQRTPSDARIHNFRGIVLASLGRSQEAAAEYRKAVEVNPEMADALRNLGFLEWQDHQLDSARLHLERALKLTPEDPFAHYYLGRIELDEHHFPQALQQLEYKGVSWPPEPAFLMDVAAAYIKVGRTEEAVRILDKVSAFPHADSQSVVLGSFYIEANESEKAIAVFRSLADGAPNPRPWAELNLAIAYLYAGQYQEASNLAQALCNRKEPTALELASAYSVVGVASARLKQNDQAVSTFQRAATLAPQLEDHWLNLTRELMDLSRYPEAITAVEEGLKANPKSYALHLRLGAARFSAGHYAEAEQVFRTLVAAGDPLPTSYIGLAQVLLRTGRAEEAVTELTSAEHRLGPQFLFSYFQGLALARAGKRNQALAAFRSAVLLSPTSAEAHLGVGKTSLALGQTNEAVAELQRVLQLDPTNQSARRLLSQAYARLGDHANDARYTVAEPGKESDPEPNLVGDFILPDWQQPGT
jgi:tetratricopeptide (TPR) repeat protein